MINHFNLKDEIAGAKKRFVRQFLFPGSIRSGKTGSLPLMGEASRLKSELAKYFKIARNREPSPLDYREFLPAAAEVLSSPPSPTRLNVGALICAMMIAMITLCWFGKVDMYAVAPGRIQPVGRSKIVQSVDTGKVRRMFVREGQYVHTGAVLAELDSTEANADRVSAASTLAALDGQIARRFAALKAVNMSRFNRPPAIEFAEGVPSDIRERETAVLGADIGKLSAGVDLLRAKIAELRAQQLSLESTVASEKAVIEVLQKRVEMRKGLQRQGWESVASVLDATETLAREEASLTRDEGQIQQNNSAIISLDNEITETIKQFAADYATELEKAQNNRDAAEQTLIKAEAKEDFTRLVSPTSGVVQQLILTSPGQVVMAGEQLMTVVPTGAALEIEALLQNRDAGFVKEGQEVVVKVDSFPFTRYGTVKGRVIHVSRDSLHNVEAQALADTQRKPIPAAEEGAAPVPETSGLVFPVTIALDQMTMKIDGKTVALSPGMSVTVEIKTGDQRVLEYVLSPLVKLGSEAIHER